MNLSELLNKRLILLSGKGGVGKTTVAVSLALTAARLKKKTLIVEMNSTERVAPHFGIKEIGQHEIALSPFITGINLNSRDCFEEYVLMQIRFKTLFNTFFNNRFVTYFLDAVPGFNELLMTGKIFDLERQVSSKRTGEPLYDLIIVDGPATGHGVSAFEVPHVVHDAVKVGPLKSQSEKIIKLITDPAKTAFSVVTMAEEMPVVEASELIKQVREKLKIPLGPLFLNAYHSCTISKEEQKKIKGTNLTKEDALFPYAAYSNLAYKRAQLNEENKKLLLGKTKGLDCITIPYLYDEITNAEHLKPIVKGWQEVLGQ